MFAGALESMDATDVRGLSDAELEALSVEILQLQSRVSAFHAKVLAEYDGRQVWAADGSRSPAMRLARCADVTPVRTAAEVRRMRGLRHMPLVREAFEEGELDVDRVDALHNVNTAAVRAAFARDERLLVDNAKQLSHEDLHVFLWRWKEIAEDALELNPVERRWRDRRVRVTTGGFGTINIEGHGPELEGSIFSRELRRIERLLFDDDLAKARAEAGDDVRLDALPRSRDQRQWDALIEMAARSASFPDEAPPKRPLVTLVVNHPTVPDICELSHNLHPVNPDEITRLFDSFDVDVERVEFDASGRAIDVSARQRVFRGRLRRAIEVRDRHCQLHPDYRVPAEDCDVDHTVEYEDGGLTSQDNGKVACGRDNRAKHLDKRRRQGRPPPGTS